MPPSSAISACRSPASTARALAARRPNALEEIARRLRGLRHRVGEAEIGVARIAEKPGALGAERNRLGHQRPVVGRPAVLAAPRPCLEGLLAEVAPRRELQEGLDARARQRDDVLAGNAAIGRRLRRRRAERLGQAGEIGLAVEDEHVGLLVGEHVLAEQCAERGEALVDRREPLLAGGVETRAGAHEIGVVAVEHAELLGVEPERRAPLPERLDPAEERLVEGDLVAVARQCRGDVALDRLERVIGIGAGQVEEHRHHLIEAKPALLERRDRVGEVGLRRIPGDRIDRLRAARPSAPRSPAGNAQAAPRRTAPRRNVRSMARGGDWRRWRSCGARFDGSLAVI